MSFQDVADACSLRLRPGRLYWEIGREEISLRIQGPSLSWRRIAVHPGNEEWSRPGLEVNLRNSVGNEGLIGLHPELVTLITRDGRSMQAEAQTKQRPGALKPS